MSKIEATIIKHSKCPKGHELVTYELVFPRFLLAELNTHRMFSKNSASSRAIPFKKMVEMVKTNPFVPIAFQKEHKGMQGTEYWTSNDFITLDTGGEWAGGVTEKFQADELLKKEWIEASKSSVREAERLNSLGVTKQLCNRLLEPFMWHKVVLTTGLEGLRNFFELRCPSYELGIQMHPSRKSWLNTVKEEDILIDIPQTEVEWLTINKGQAEIHMMELAEQMYDAYNESIPQNLKEGEWHVPYEETLQLAYDDYDVNGELLGSGLMKRIKASTGMLARASYITIGDDKVPSIETLISIHDKMVNARPKHSSPMEHCSKVMTEEEYYLFSKGMDGQKDHEHGWCYNYRGFMNYRYILEQTHQA